jgi:hypothetical protein
MFLQQNQRLIVQCILFFCGLINLWQLPAIKQIFFESGGAGVCPDEDIPDDEGDILPKLGQFFLRFLGFLFHKNTVERKSVIPHNVHIYCGRRFYFFHHIAVFGKKAIKLAVQQMVQPRSIIRVGTGVPHGFFGLRVKFIEV